MAKDRQHGRSDESTASTAPVDPGAGIGGTPTTRAASASHTDETRGAGKSQADDRER